MVIDHHKIFVFIRYDSIWFDMIQMSLIFVMCIISNVIKSSSNQEKILFIVIFFASFANFYFNLSLQFQMNEISWIFVQCWLLESRWFKYWSDLEHLLNFLPHFLEIFNTWKKTKSSNPFGKNVESIRCATYWFWIIFITASLFAREPKRAVKALITL